MHIPVLQKEVIEYLDLKPNENFIDATVGEGGHSFAILEKTAPKGKVLGIDLTPELIKSLSSRVQNLKLDPRFILVCGNFANLEEIVQKHQFRPVRGILFDLGLSSWHLEDSRRGFSFQRKEPLDMRYSPQDPLTAKIIVNNWSKEEIEKILKEFGEERFAPKIAKEIVESRKIRAIKSTLELVQIVKRAVPGWYQHKRIHFATKTFQALRIAVNDELENLKEALSQALGILEPEGRLAVISFHSLEDRIVKNFFREEKLLKILTKKPIRPSGEEIKINPRSRSARLRVGQKL